MVGKGLERQRSYPAVIGLSPPHAMVPIVLNSSPELLTLKIHKKTNINGLHYPTKLLI